MYKKQEETVLNFTNILITNLLKKR